MLGKIMHVGLLVKDLDVSIHFYCEILGLKLMSKMEMKGKETDLLFNRKNVIAKIAYVKSDNDNLPPVELIQYENIETEVNKSTLFTRGIAELCFEVEDIEKEYLRLKKLGVKFLSEPQEFDFSSSGYGISKAVYFMDPDNIILELMQVIKN